MIVTGPRALARGKYQGKRCGRLRDVWEKGFWHDLICRFMSAPFCFVRLRSTFVTDTMI